MPRGKRITAEDREKILSTIREVGYQQIGACRAVDFATKSGFSYDAIRMMRSRDAGFRDAVVAAQEEFRASLQGRCENMLIRRAIGYDATEQICESTMDGAGNVVSRRTTDRRKHVAPDVRALEFVLINISKGAWRDVRDVEVTTSFGDRKDLSPEEVRRVREQIKKAYNLDDSIGAEVEHG